MVISSAFPVGVGVELLFCRMKDACIGVFDREVSERYDDGGPAATERAL